MTSAASFGYRRSRCGIILVGFDQSDFSIRIQQCNRNGGLGEILTSASDVAIGVPSTFALHQNYPNPFNPSTTISYTLPVQSFVTLKVFNVLGQEVATLVNGIESPGSKSVRFDGGRLPSGVYFYRLQAGSYSGTRMLLIVK